MLLAWGIKAGRAGSYSRNYSAAYEWNRNFPGGENREIGSANSNVPPDQNREHEDVNGAIRE